jgi:hypothetical protein
LAVCFQNEFFIKVYYSQTSGFNEVIYPVLMSWYNDLDIGDVNSDGRNDVIFMPGSSYYCIRVFYQDSVGSLGPPVNYFNPVPLQYAALDGISVGDVNDDGKSDIVATGGGNIPGASLIVWYQDSQGQLNNPVRLKAYEIPGPIEIRDMDNDGKNEIVTVHAGWQKVSVYSQNSAGVDSNYQLINVPYLNNLPNNALALADLDNDGWKDIAIAGQTYGLMVLYHDSSHISVNDFSIENSISVFPNPCSDKVYINSPYRNFSVDIYDAKMQFLFTKNLNSGSLKMIDLSGYDCGIYYLQLNDSHKSHTKKIVKIN